MIENLNIQKPFNRKWSTIIFSVIVVICIASSLIYYLQVKQVVMTDATNSIVVYPSSTGLGERFAFTSILADNFSPVPVIGGGLLLIFILEAVLIYRIIATRKIISNASKIIHSIVYQLFVVIIFFGIYFTSLFFSAGMLTSQASQYISSSADYKQILAGNVTTDPEAVHSLIKSDPSRIVIAQNPLLVSVALKPQKTFFETYIVPRYVKYHENDLDNKFKQFANLPYYFIAPNYLIVQEKVKFTKDLGYDVMRNILVSQYRDNVMKTPPTFSVVSKDQFASQYRTTQIKRFEKDISVRNKFIEENNWLIKDNNRILAEAEVQLADNPTQLTSLKKEAETIKQVALSQNAQEQQNIVKLNSIIKEFSDSNSVNYERSEIIGGGFIPPATILIREPFHSYDNLALDDLGELIRVIVHESLHYYANNDTQNELTDFLYEGFTEYLALKAIGYPDDTMVIPSGYPLHIQVMTLLAKRMPLTLLEKINFSQDQKLFESSYKKYFPESNYKDFSELTDQINLFWFTGGFGKLNSDYINDPLIIKAKEILKI